MLAFKTGVKMLWAPGQAVRPDQNLLIRWFRRVMPITPELHGQRFFVRVDGRRHATPLLVALLFLEMRGVRWQVRHRVVARHHRCAAGLCHRGFVGEGTVGTAVQEKCPGPR